MHAWERMHVYLITALHSYYHMLGEENMLYFKFGGCTLSQTYTNTNTSYVHCLLRSVCRVVLERQHGWEWCNCNVKTVIHDLGGTYLQCINRNTVSLTVCCDALTVTIDQGGSHLLCKNNELVRKVYWGLRLRVYEANWSGMWLLGGS